MTRTAIGAADGPDFTERLRLLRWLAPLHLYGGVPDLVRNQLRFSMPDSVLELIAHRVVGDLIDLDRALIKVLAMAARTQTPVDETVTEAALFEYERAMQTAWVRVDVVVAVVARHLGVALEDLRSPGATREVAQARHIAMYLAKTLTVQTLPTIGLEFGCGHSSVMYAYKRILAKAADDLALRATIDSLTEQILGSERG